MSLFSEVLEFGTRWIWSFSMYVPSFPFPESIDGNGGVRANLLVDLNVLLI